MKKSGSADAQQPVMQIARHLCEVSQTAAEVGEPQSTAVQAVRATGRDESERARRLLVMLLALAAVVFGSQAAKSLDLDADVALLAGGFALVLAALVALVPVIKPLLKREVTVEVLAVPIALSAYGLTRGGLPDDLLTIAFIGTVIVTGVLVPARRAMPLVSAVALLAGYAVGTPAHGISLVLVAAVAATGVLTSIGSTRTRQIQARRALESDNLSAAAENLAAENTTIKETSEVAKAVLEVANGFTAAVEPAAIADQITRGTTIQLRAVGAILLQWDEAVETFRVGAIMGNNAPGGTEFRQVEVPPDSLPVLQPMSPNEVVHLHPDVVREPMLRSLLQRWKTTAILGVRLQRGDHLLGLLFVARSQNQGRFSAKDSAMLSGIAVHAAAALEHADLIASLQSANHLKGEFMATMSHELRTPLNVIIGYTDLQLEGAFGELAEEHRETLGTVREQALQLLELIQATLDMSRLERGLVTVDLRDISTSEFFEQLQAQIPSSWRKSNVELYWRLTPGLPRFRTDPSKLQILLRNLIHNALKFTHNGMVTVSASAHPSKPYLTFVVQDSGIGIKAEHLSDIFEMFRQTPNTEGTSGGVGLGLYIVRRLAGVLGAEIELRSAPGRGATFRIHLPLAGPLAGRC